MYFLKTGSPGQLRWLRALEPLMVATGIVQLLATLPSISKLYFTHSQDAPGQSFDDVVDLCRRKVFVSHIQFAQSEPAIYVGNIIGLVVNLLMMNGILINTDGPAEALR